MSSQLELMMQLYMMNLLQQQQQFGHNSSPSKQKDNVNNIGSQQLTSNATFVPIQSAKMITSQLRQPIHQDKIEKRQNSKNTQNINCSSSRSCSPNSNSSFFIQNNSLVQNQAQQQLLQQPMLLQTTVEKTNAMNNLISLTQLMFQQQQQQQIPLLTTPSNLILTPTTPNSQNSPQFTKTSLVSDNLSGKNIGQCSNFPFVLPPTNFQHTTPNVAPISFTAQNFLQSSTVTSTPTEEKNSNSVQVDDGDGDGNESVLRHRISTLSGNGYSNDDDDAADEEINNDVDEKFKVKDAANPIDDDKNISDEDDLPLSCLQTSSSGVVSSCATSGENLRKLNSSSDLQGVKSSMTIDGTNMMNSAKQTPYTPIKQEADSSLNCTATPIITQHQKVTVQNAPKTPNTTINDDSNMTPLALAANALLTPPSSEQLVSNPFDSNQTTLYQTTGSTSAAMSLNLTIASSLDAFLQNEDNLKNLKKYGSYLECENPLCRQENLREHFHCFDSPCQGKILSKKDDIIRHLKWHKKRKESFQLGFARFSSSDDCSSEYGEGCAYNWKQTHYHCVYEDCPKVYVSTSDVQMHANFHRKNSEIVQEGFRRFRAQENCKTEECPFFGKKMSHYHCCREGCNHTFKNKADMDKHKSYHLKDYQLTQDGFKKILKTEVCPFENCKFSTTCNHIHCVRSDCNYVLHSSSQMISHKRKHDRVDGEQAYQCFKKQQKESSEDESPTSTHQQQQQQQQNLLASCTGNNISTPLSSHTSAEQFLSRKRGRPPKMIQLSAESSNSDSKRLKSEVDTQQQQQQQLFNLATAMPIATSSIFPPFLPNFNSAAAAAAMQQSMEPYDPNAPNFQLTHLMALFQLQNPLFYQNLYPGGMAGLLAAGALPQNVAMLGNLAAFNAATATAAANTPPQIKSEYSDNKQFKE